MVLDNRWSEESDHVGHLGRNIFFVFPIPHDVTDRD